jgi:hypothetical protein
LIALLLLLKPNSDNRTGLNLQAKVRTGDFQRYEERLSTVYDTHFLGSRNMVVG